MKNFNYDLNKGGWRKSEVGNSGLNKRVGIGNTKVYRGMEEKQLEHRILECLEMGRDQSVGRDSE